MNRQFRRAQEKQDKRQEKERERRRSERRSKRRRSRPARVKPKPSANGSAGKGSGGKGGDAASGSGDKSKEVTAKGGGKDDRKPADRKRLPGRFSGVLTFVTVFFISLQGAAPVEEEQAGVGVGASLISAGFYLMLGYFATLWFMRRGVNRAPLMSVIGGVILAGSVTAATLIQGRELDPLLLALVIPALIAGSLLGRLVFVASPR